MKNKLASTALMDLVSLYQYPHNRNLRSNYNSLILTPFQTNTISGEKCLRYYLPLYINQCPSNLITAIETKSKDNFFKFAKSYFIEKYENNACLSMSCFACQAKFLSPIFRFIRNNLSYFHSWSYSYILIVIFKLNICLNLFGMIAFFSCY